MKRLITNDSSYVRRGSLNNYTQYPNLDAAIAHRPAWAACVAMYNLDSTGSRMPIRSNETLSSETLLGAHRSDGFLQLMNDDLTHWNNDYWNNVDWDALPGTTEASGIAIPSGGESYTNGSNWAGGAGVDEFGVSGLELMPTNTTVFGYLHALKGWFFFDNEIVCLGADIRKTNAAETHKFHTIVENWKLKSDNSNVFTVDGTTQPTTAGWTANFTPTWANLSGSVTGTNTGYYFPAAGQSVAANRILTGGVYFLEMYINHGIPSAGSYQYVVLPNMTAAQTQTYASAPPISVLENTSSAMAVQKASVGVTSALFWQSVGHTVNLSGSSALSSNKAAAVVVHKTTGQLKIGISDPSQNPSAGTASITVWPNLTGTITGTVSVDSGVTVTQTTPTLILKVSFLGTSGGKTFNASFTTSP